MTYVTRLASGPLYPFSAQCVQPFRRYGKGARTPVSIFQNDLGGRAPKNQSTQYICWPFFGKPSISLTFFHLLYENELTQSPINLLGKGTESIRSILRENESIHINQLNPVDWYTIWTRADQNCHNSAFLFSKSLQNRDGCNALRLPVHWWFDKTQEKEIETGALLKEWWPKSCRRW